MPQKRYGVNQIVPVSRRKPTPIADNSGGTLVGTFGLYAVRSFSGSERQSRPSWKTGDSRASPRWGLSRGIDVAGTDARIVAR